MKTLTTIFLIVALTAPGTVLAGPADGATLSLWRSVVAWMTDALGGLPDAGGFIDSVGAVGSTPRGQEATALDGEIDLSGLTVEPVTPGQAENQAEPQPILDYGGAVDPAG